MVRKPREFPLCCVAAIESLEPRLLLSGFTAYNEVAAGPQTHANTTLYADNGGNTSGLLRDIATGESTQVLLSTFAVGVNFAGTGANPSANTDAADIFNGFVDFSARTGNNLEISGADTYTYVISNMDPGNTYEFAGSAIRGNDDYTNRWTLVTLSGAASYVAAHSNGDGIITAGLGPNQVAIWVGANHRSDQGFVVQWTDIDPGSDGIVEVVSTQYTGATPFGMANGSKGYGINGIRLIEHEPSAPPELINTPATDIEAFAAEIGGEITRTGGEAPNVTIYYGDNDGGSNAGAWDHSVDVGRQSRTYSEVIAGLDQNTTYFYRSFAVNSIGSAWAPTTETFSTLAASAPTVVNVPASNVGAFSAWLNGDVTDTGNDPPLVTIFYGPQDGGTNPAAWLGSISVGAQAGAFTAGLDDLDPATTYYYTAFAQNAVGGAWATPSLSLLTTEPPPLQITEFMADNATTLVTRTRDSASDPFVGDMRSPDWIEVHNPTDTVAVIGGFNLTDDLGDPFQWAFPAGTSIDPGGYLIVFASGDDIRDPALDEHGYLHADFKLKDDGSEDVALTDADGEVVFSYESFPVQSEDVSYGIGLDSVERFYPAPTPGWDNANDVPRAPQFSVASTTFTGSILVELTAGHPTDTIHYTTNETTPTAASPVYTGPLTISNTTMLRAVTVGSNGKSSHLVSETYLELGADVINSSSNLPIVVVQTFGDGVPGSHSPFGDAYFAVFEPGADGRTRLTDPFTIGTRGGIHVRGSSSAGFAKKQYRIEFWDESNEDRKLEVLGMPSEADWILYGPGQYDRALINNPLMFDLSNQVGQYATRTVWVEMYLDHGGGQVTRSDYAGVQAVMEIIEEGDDRVDVGSLSTGAGGQPVEGGFIWKNDRGSAYVDPESPTSAQSSYINSWINGLEWAATSSSFKDPNVGYAAWAEVDTFIDHNLLNMLAMNVDAMRLSGYYYKTADSKIVAGPIWDFDRSLDSTDSRDNNPMWWNGTGDSTLFFNDGSRVKLWWPRMFQDPDFVQLYIDRWFELRKTTFSLSNIYATIDAHAAQLMEAAPRDYARWYSPRYGNFAGEIQHMKNWLTTRISWVDSQWLAAPTFSGGGPVVSPGTQVSLWSSTGTVYYTLDGSDPRGENGAVSGSAIRATGPITINTYTQITARVYKSGHGSTAQGYIPTGDDWSPPAVGEYFVNPLAGAGDVAITEINYHPYDATPEELASQPPADPDFQDNDFEFIEFENVSGHVLNIGGVRFDDGVKFKFPSYVLAPGERIVIAEDLAGFTARYGINGSLDGTGITVAGVWAGELDNGGERVTVLARNGVTIQDFIYNDSGGWPGRADGKGATLVAVDVAGDYSAPGNWQSSVRYGGTPGGAAEAELGIVINEVLTHTDLPQVDTIELYNAGGAAVDIAGWYLSDSWGWEDSQDNGNYKKFEIPVLDLGQPGKTLLAPGQYILFDEYDFNLTGLDADPGNDNPRDFALSGAHGDDVWLMRADDDDNLTHFGDHVDFGGAPNGESFGRWPNGTGPLAPMLDLTLGSANTGPRIGPLVITEIQYYPGDFDDPNDLEFLEIHNPTGVEVNLTGWRIRKGVDYDFEDGAFIAPRGSIVVLSFNPDNPDNDAKLADFRLTYGIDASVPVMGGYSGSLDNGGETVQLQRPDLPPLDEPNYTPHLLEDEVDYEDDPPWPAGAAGTGLSIHRLAANLWGNDPISWQVSDPTPGLYVTPVVTVDFLLTNDPRPALSGTVEDPAAVVVITANGKQYAAVNHGDGTWTLADNTISPPLADGTYDVQAAATSPGEPTDYDTTTRELTIDTQGPTVTVDLLLTGNVNPPITGTVDDATAAIEVTVDGNTYTGVNNRDGTWTLPDDVISPPLGDGTYDVLVAATDPAGNIGYDSTSDELVIETVGPNITIFPVVTRDGSPPLSGAIDDPAATILITIDGRVFPAVNNGDGTWDLADGAINPPLADGTYDVQAAATDVPGNTGYDMTADELTIDSTPPAITVTVLVTDDTTPPLSGTINDPDATIVVTVEGIPYAAVNHGATWTVDDDAIDPPLADGRYDVQVEAVDLLLNVGHDTSDGELTIDTVAPIVTVDPLSTDDTTPPLSGTVNDPAATVLITVGGRQYTADTHADGTWTLPDGTILPALGDGSHDVQVAATDLAGNTGYDTTTDELTIDATPPSVPGNLLAAAATSTQIDLTWDESVDPLSGVDHYVIYRNGGAIGTSPTTAFSDTGRDETQTYTYEVSAVNPGGLESNRSAPVQATPSPSLRAAEVLDDRHIRVVFGKPLNQASAETAANYTVTDEHGRALTVTDATRQADTRVVHLAFGEPMLEDVIYTLGVENVTDLADNAVQPGSEVTFTNRNVDESLLAWWTLDDGIGNVAQDVTGNGRDLQVVGATWAAGRVGGAVRLDGTAGSYLVDEDGESYLNGLAAFTVAMWVKSDVIGTDRGFFNTRDPGRYDCINLRHAQSAGAGGASNTIVAFTSTTSADAVVEGQPNTQSTDWQHVALTWVSGQELMLYLDGQLQTPTFTVGPLGGTVAHTTKVLVGKGELDTNSSWLGLIDDLRIYDRQLAAGELVALADQRPVAVDDDDYEVNQDDTLTVSAANGVLANDADPDSGPQAMTAVLAGDVSHGQLTLNPDGSFEYTPTAGYTGEDSFSYQAYDGAKHSNVAKAALTVVSAAPPVVTVDPLGTNDPSPALTGTVDDSNATIEITVDGRAYAAINNGDGTWTLPDDTIAPLLADGTYDVEAAATNQAQLTGHDGSSGELTVDTTAPCATGLLVASTAWDASFMDELGGVGFAVVAGGDQLDELPWVNLDQVKITFSEDVSVEQGDLAIHGVAVSQYAVAGFSYDAAGFTATWTLATVVPADKLLMVLSDAVTDGMGNALDGEWSDAVSTYPSGNGAAGGNLVFGVNVLPGDADQSGEVRSSDVIKVRRKGNTAPGNADYSIHYDVDGSGEIRSSDVIKVRRLGNTQLPAGEPAPPPSAPAAMGELYLEASGTVSAVAPLGRPTVSMAIAAATDILLASDPISPPCPLPATPTEPGAGTETLDPDTQPPGDDADLDLVDVLSTPQLDPFAAQAT